MFLRQQQQQQQILLGPLSVARGQKFVDELRQTSGGTFSRHKKLETEKLRKPEQKRADFYLDDKLYLRFI